MSVASFDALSEDILLCVFTHATPLSIRRCQRVCRLFRKLITTSQYLQYLLELDACGYVEPLRPRLDLSYAEKTEMLRRHSLRWRSIEKITPERYGPPLGSAVPLMLKLVAGTFVWADGDAMDFSLTHVTICRLPSNNRGTQFERHKFKLPFRVQYLVLDPELDLVAYLETDNENESMVSHTIHLRTICTNDAHPGAARSQLVIQHPRNPERSRRAYDSMTIFGTSLAGVFQLYTNRYRAVIWNWTTGQELLHLDIDHSLSMARFELLSESSFVLSQSLPPGSTTSWPPLPTLCHLEVYRFDSEAVVTTPAIHQASFGLPDYPGSYGFGVRLESAIYSKLNSQSSPSIYSTPPGDQLLWATTFTGPRRNTGLCVPVSVLLDFIHSNASPTSNDPHPFIPWVDWAPHAFYEHNPGAGGSPMYRNKASGQRAIFTQGARSSEDDAFALVDYNRQRIRACNARISSSGDVVDWSSDPRYIHGGLCLKSEFHVFIDVSREELQELWGEECVPVSCYAQEIDDEHSELQTGRMNALAIC